MNNSDTWCRCLRLRCRDCGWEGNQRAALTHTALTGDLPGIVVMPMCGETPCRSEMRARAEALAQHNPPTEIWFDEAGEIRTRCLTDDPNPDCNGCRETECPTGEHWRWAPGGTA